MSDDRFEFPPNWQPLSARSTDDVSEHTLHRILDAAGRLFTRFGVTRVKVADVAAEAGVSKATLYRYVSSKDSLVELYAIREGRALIDRVMRARWHRDITVDEIADLVADIYARVRTHPVAAKVLSDEPEFFQHELVSGDEFRADADALVDYLAPLLAHFGYDDPRFTVEALLRMAVSLVLFPPPAADADESRDAARRFFRLVLRDHEAADGKGSDANTNRGRDTEM